VQAGEGLSRGALHSIFVEEDAVELLASEEHVLDDVEIVREGKVLVDGLDASEAASLGLRMWTGLPLQSISPWSGWWMPATVLVRTDLPAPLSPQRAVTCPAGRSRLTSNSACTAPKCLLMPSA